MKYGIALGSNLGERLEHLREAVHALQRSLPDLRLLSAARLYETDPVDCPAGSQAFYNSVIEVETASDPLPLLDALLAIEQALGRPLDRERNAPRPVDLDLLYAETVQFAHPRLILPHPRMTLRRFVLEPLNDIRPDLVLPGQTQSVSALLGQLQSDEPPLRIVAAEWV